MKLLFLTLGEFSDPEELSMYPDLLRCFQEHGHEVFVAGVREQRYGLPTELKTAHGMKILRVRTGNITKTNPLEKGISTLLIGLQLRHAVNQYFKGIEFNLILYSTPPITILTTVKYLKKKHKAFTYLLLKDIFPQNALDIGMLKETGPLGLITRYFFSIEKQLYLISDCIGCMSEANVEFIKTRHPYLLRKRIELCPNTMDLITVTEVDRTAVRENLQLPKEKIIFICGGNFGKPQDVDFMIRVLQQNEGAVDRHFIMCGSGTEFYKLKKYSRERKAKHITILEALNKNEFHQLLDACDVGMIFLDHRFTIPNVPSRLLDYMNHSLPVIAATDTSTDVGEIITENGFGWWCESVDVKAYQKILEDICAHPEVLVPMGNKSRATLNDNYNTDKAYQTIIHACHLGGIE